MPIVFAEEFDGPALDLDVWLPHYLPAWSSRAETAAAYEVRDPCLHLSIPPPARAVDAGGARGAAAGLGRADRQLLRARRQHGRPAAAGAGRSVVREYQPLFQGFTPRYGRLEMRARGVVTPRSMVAWWMVGLEDRPDRCAEICVFEVFGDAVEPGRSAAVGMGLHSFRDPATPEDFAAPRLPIDVAEFHDYAVDWRAEEAAFSVDGELVRTCPRPPAYPMQMMVAVIDFPDRSTGDDDGAVPELLVDHLRAT